MLRGNRSRRGTSSAWKHQGHMRRHEFFRAETPSSISIMASILIPRHLRNILQISVFRPSKNQPKSQGSRLCEHLSGMLAIFNSFSQLSSHLN